MKKALLGICLCFVLFILAGCSTRENPDAAVPVTEEETGSEFEEVMLKKGSLIVKEFIDCGFFEKDEYFDYSTNNELFGFTDTIKFQTASLLDVETGKKVYALRITTGYYTSKYNYGEAVGVMDADELDGAIQTLQYVKDHINELKDYSEVIYTASSGMQVGAFHSSDKEQIFVKVDSNATKFYPVSKIDGLISLFEEVSTKLKEAAASAS